MFGVQAYCLCLAAKFSAFRDFKGFGVWAFVDFKDLIALRLRGY